MNKRRYREIVGKCILLHETIKNARYKIAEYSLEILPMNWGKGRKHSDYSIRKFAQDIGIAERTLSEWRTNYVTVVSHLKEGDRVQDDANIIRNAVADVRNKGASPRSAYKKRAKITPDMIALDTALDYTKRANFTITKKFRSTLHEFSIVKLRALDKVLTETLKEVRKAIRKKEKK